MKLEPTHVIKDNPINNLSTLEKKCYYVAITVAFISVFVWVAKILFF